MSHVHPQVTDKKQSRVGKRPIAVPKGVTVNVGGSKVDVQGPKGKLSQTLHPSISLKREGDVLHVSANAIGRDAARLQGLGRALVASMVRGAAEGYERILELVGTGYRLTGQVTPESLTAIESADKLFHLVQDIVTHHWLEERNPSAESLADAYRPGRPRRETYEEMVERMLAPVRAGKRVCAAFYGHPGVFVFPAHEAIRRARAEGFEAVMLPGISAEDCLVAELGFDPGQRGCQTFEATDFLVRRRRFDPTSHLVLWQLGGLGVTDFREGDLWNRPALGVLAEALAKQYGGSHEVELYEAPPYPICPAKRVRCRLDTLADAPVTLATTLYVPPLPDRASDPAMRAALGMPTEPPG